MDEPKEAAAAHDTAYALLVMQLSALSQSAALRARLDADERETLRFLCDDLAKALTEDA